MALNSNADKTSNQAWDRFAETDPYTYILTSLPKPDPQLFWQSGEHTVAQELLPLIREHGVRTRVAFELGCGVGRLILPLSNYFLEVIGVDIAEGMVKRARSFARDKGIQNVEFAAISGPEDLLHKAGTYVSRVDFLYSLLVFQHIPDFSVIEGYLHVIGVLLEENGIAYLQFDTRQQDFSYRLKTGLPDFLLPRFWRRGIRRVRRSAEEIEGCLTRAGLEVTVELTPHTAYHRYLLRRKRRPESAK
jgi:cyclopropane fatty-acyl-phospholipid synthase-like methyltransferase